jgi:hypothetical protein
MTLGRKVKIFLFTNINVLAVVWIAFAQMQGGQGFGGQNRGQDLLMAAGELVQIDARSLTIRTQDGETKQFIRTDQTAFIKETPADRSDLVQGVNVLVVGQPSGQNTVTPVMIRITEKLEELPEQRGQGDQKMQGGRQMGDGQQMGGGRMMGNDSRDQMMSGPVVGTITGVNPLTIQRTSGGSVLIEPTGDTRIMREISVNPSDIAAGTQVRIIAPPKPGSDSREAKKVILLSRGEHALQRRAVNAATAVDTSKTIGYVGCSLSGTKFWPEAEAAETYPGGSVVAWNEDLKNAHSRGNRWQKFEELLAKYPNTNAILWHLCPSDSGGTSYSQVVQVFSEIKKKTTVTIFVMAGGVNDIPCSKDDERCPKWLGTLVDRMALPTLNPSQIGPDGHPNKEGQKIWGRALIDFFRDH